ncbi:heme anaerobic degradation radical SAM methyltransferase ChuW/HutW [Thiocapsa rosea]|nr:heme anaerobic degradation radical SAM methyltransferase ChuW/HutW [Thiocapsa rosea]
MNAMIDVTEHFARVSGDPIKDAFPARRPMMPWATKTPVPDEEIGGIWQGMIEGVEPPRDRRLAYVHIPFCTNHCLFCGFYRHRLRDGGSPAFADLVIEEIRREAQAPGIGARPIQAVYLGGGTPTALAPVDIQRILETLSRQLPLAPDCEVTVEGRVKDFTPEMIDACLAGGATRFSIGVQTFDTEVRRRQGRQASGAQAERVLGDLIARRAATVVLDLVYGFPDQTPEIWSEDLRICHTLGPDGVDLYALNLIRGAPLQQAIEHGKIAAPADLSQQGELYRIGADALAELGWRQISNSHWARTHSERNRYNRLIKRGADCLAYGAGAGGSIGRYSYSLTADLDPYREAIRRGDKPLGTLHVADALAPLRDRIAGGIEIGCLDLSYIEAVEAPGLLPTLEPLFDQWAQAGLLRRDGSLIHLTTAGRFWSPNLLRALNRVQSEMLTFA